MLSDIIVTVVALVICDANGSFLTHNQFNVTQMGCWQQTGCYKTALHESKHRFMWQIYMKWWVGQKGEALVLYKMRQIPKHIEQSVVMTLHRLKPDEQSRYKAGSGSDTHLWQSGTFIKDFQMNIFCFITHKDPNMPCRPKASTDLKRLKPGDPLIVQNLKFEVFVYLVSICIISHVSI